MTAPLAILNQFIADTHVHFWNPAELDYFWLQKGHALNRAFLPADIEDERRASGVGCGIYVQASHDKRENAWALALAHRTDWIHGVVGWLDLTAPTLNIPNDPLFKGVRHLTHDIPEHEWLRRPDVNRSLHKLGERGLSVDLVLRPEQLGDAVYVAQQHPHLQFILDHLGNPPLRGDLSAWKDALIDVAACPNVAVKVSGLLTQFTYCINENALHEAVHHGLTAFGPERVMYGGDWPVCTQKASYQSTLQWLTQAIDTFPVPHTWPADWKDRLWHVNAHRIYRFHPHPLPESE